MSFMAGTGEMARRIGLVMYDARLGDDELLLRCEPREYILRDHN